MNFTYALLLSVFIALVILENYGYGYWMISRPIFAGPMIGLIMGDLQTGLIVGASVELMYLGVLPVGGSVPPNAQIAGMLSTVFAIANGGNPEVGISLALPIGVLAQLLIMLAWNINIILMHKADQHIEEGDFRSVERTHLLGLPIFFLVFFIPTFLAVYYGSDAVNSLVSMLPETLMEGLKVASGLLPAVGMAMLLKMMDFGKYWPFYILGFIMSVYLELDVLAISLMAFTLIVARFKLKSDGFSKLDDEALDDEEISTLDPSILKKTFRRSFFSMTSINYERYTSLGFCYAMIPAIEHLYDKKEDQISALKRHNEFFNCHPYTGNAVMGVTLALEESLSQEVEGISPEAISSTKSALMGPLSGIGDSVFKAVFMTVFAAIGSGLALEGSMLGPIVFIVPNVLLNVFSRWYFIKYGYKFGTNLILKLHSSDILDKFVTAATIIGMMVVGAMSVSFVKVPIDLSWTFGEVEIELLDLINSIIPGILPVLLVLLYYKILKTNDKGMYWNIAISFILGILGKYIGIF